MTDRLVDEAPRTVGVVLFEGFELLDVFGPLEMLGQASRDFSLVLLGPSAGAVTSAQGPRSVVDHVYAEAPPCDILFVPGGRGTRALVHDAGFVAWLATTGAHAEYLLSVCTGSALLAAAGLLDGYRATSNKLSFEWVTQQGPGVEWVSEARWVEDRNRWTSSGVAAGIDMALAFIAHMCGDERATRIADGTEYERHPDASWDPFAAKAGLVPRGE